VAVLLGFGGCPDMAVRGKVNDAILLLPAAVFLLQEVLLLMKTTAGEVWVSAQQQQAGQRRQASQLMPMRKVRTQVHETLHRPNGPWYP
jgi:hypothetical protein